MFSKRVVSVIFRRGDSLSQTSWFDNKTSIHRLFSSLTNISPNCVNRSANFDAVCRTVMASSQNKSKNKPEPTVRKVILSTCAPKPVGPYSQAVQFGNTLFLSGCLGMDKDKMELVQGVGNQAKQALTNIGHILKAAGTTYENVIKTSIFLANIADYSEVNGVYKEFFTSNPPSRTTFQVAGLPLGALVEIEVIAGLGEIEHASCSCGSKM